MPSPFAPRTRRANAPRPQGSGREDDWKAAKFARDGRASVVRGSEGVHAWGDRGRTPSAGAAAASAFGLSPGGEPWGLRREPDQRPAACAPRVAVDAADQRSPIRALVGNGVRRADRRVHLLGGSIVRRVIAGCRRKRGQAVAVQPCARRPAPTARRSVRGQRATRYRTPRVLVARIGVNATGRSPNGSTVRPSVLASSSG